MYKMFNTAAIKSLLLFMAGLFTGFLVEKCVACQNSVIRSRMASFSFSPCFVDRRQFCRCIIGVSGVPRGPYCMCKTKMAGCMCFENKVLCSRKLLFL